ncbi:aldo/keto reductase [Coxiella endosymbiont of Ornithodoros maritimus]|uniref:aldo/keto reductase n=1 Tax=Coxiella endosymbiont of Ornithodoros maritimus TaxID=1656172 RepID=UPI0022647529|nr:aldo/keto reductase [Coxiella endosymbiont of Ornithodoros maritimus]
MEITYRHIDCAPIYFNESTIGNALKDAIKVGDVVREELWNSDHASEDVELACKKTLNDLRLDYLDLYLITLGR